MASVYSDVFRKHSITTKGSFEGLIQKYFRHSIIRHLHDDLIENENEWDSMLEEVDKSIASENDKALQLGDRLPDNIMLTDARSGGVISLGNLGLEFNGKHLVFVLLRHFA